MTAAKARTAVATATSAVAVSARVCLLGVFVVGAVAPLWAQEPKSAPLARQLAAALDAAKLDSIAAKDPSNPEVYVGALYMPGLQLMAISAKYSAPQLLDERLARKEYRDVYIDLNSAGTAATKVFVMDLGNDGVRARRDGDQPSDSVDVNGKTTTFDGEWRRQKMSEDDYMKAFNAADERYTQMLTALLAQLKQTS
jgi:hypothetical protein